MRSRDVLEHRRSELWMTLRVIPWTEVAEAGRDYCMVPSVAAIESERASCECGRRRSEIKSTGESPAKLS